MRLHDHFTATSDLWAPGEEKLAWHVLPEGQLDMLADWLAPALERPYLAPVPKEWLHLTVGAPAAGDLAEVVARATERVAELEAFSALAGPVRVVDQGFSADVQPRDELTALRDAVTDERHEFWPHITFAYACEEGAEAEELEVNASDAFLVEAVTLIRLRREPRYYAWDVVARAPLTVRYQES